MPRTNIGEGQMAIYSAGRSVAPTPNATFIFDVSGLRDPLSNRGFRHSKEDGRDPSVKKFVSEDPRVAAIMEQVAILAHLNFRGQSQTGGWISFLFKDVQGQWIAPAVTELVAEMLDNLNYRVSVHHWSLGGASK